jgi:hypothetical protein
MARAFSPIRLGIAVIAACLISLAMPLSAQAGLTLSIDHPNQTAAPGSDVDFYGTITNNTGFYLDALTQLFTNFDNYNPSVLSFNQDLGSPDFLLAPGATSADVLLFDVLVSPSAASGSYLADVTIQDVFGDLSNDVTISVTVPEPGSLPVLLTAFLLMFGFVRSAGLGALRRSLGRLAIGAFVLFWVGSAQAAVTPVQLLTLNGVNSVWATSPNNVGVELQIGNNGTGDANNVNVTSIAVQGGSFSGPGSLPIALGTIAAGADTMLDFVVTVPKTDGTAAYRLTISGSYMYSGKVYGFTLNWAIIPNAAGPGTITARNGLLPKQNPVTATYPLPPPPLATNNAETPNFVPLGPPQLVSPPTPTGTSLGTAAGSPSVQIPVNNTNVINAGIPPDPNAAAEGGGVVLTTFNTGISYSIDGGTTFTFVNLFNPVPGEPGRTSFFPQSDGGLCCDQIVIYDPVSGLFFWSQQYQPITACATNCGLPTQTNKITQPDRERIAWATPAQIKANFYDNWTYIDLTATGIGAAKNEWVDYPDLAVSPADNFLYFDVDHGFPTPGKVYTGQRIVARLSMSDIVNPAIPTVGYSYALLTGSNGLNKDHIAQNAPGKMVLASLDNSSTLRVFTWNDTDSTISNATVGISSINQGSNYTSIAPDFSDWVAVSFPGNITGATYRQVFGPQDQYIFAFDAGVNGSGRPNSYVRLETLTPSGGGWNVVEEYDIWNPNYAFAMAALGTDNSDEIGITLGVGGGTVGYPQDSVGFKDDFVVYQVTNSNATQISRFGDYFAARPIPGLDNQFAAEVYDVVLPSGSPPGATCNTVGCSANMHYVQFGRPPSQNQGGQ